MTADQFPHRIENATADLRRTGSILPRPPQFVVRRRTFVTRRPRWQTRT